MESGQRITDAEWEIMKVLWSQAPCTANEVVEALEQRMSWKPNTVKTLLSRLVKKKAVDYREVGKSYRYFPLIEQEEYVRTESRSFLQRMYGGTLKPMLAHFLREEKLSRQEIEDLKRILDERL